MTFSNTFVAQPLTAANVQRVIDDMQTLSPLVVQPDVLVVPPGLIESALHDARVAVERLVRKLAQPISTGRFEQRRRRKAQGVWATRARRLQRLERRLVDVLDVIEMLEDFRNT